MLCLTLKILPAYSRTYDTAKTHTHTLVLLNIEIVAGVLPSM